MSKGDPTKRTSGPPRGSARFVAVLIAGGFVVAACSQSPIAPDADVSIRGSVQRTGGQPVEDTGVVLSKEGDLGDALSVIASIGIACFSEDPPALCDDGLTSRTGSDGSFSFSVKGSFTHGSFGQASTLVLSSHLPRGELQAEGPSSIVRFQAQTTNLSIPIKIWEPTVELSGDTSQASVRWSEFPADLLPSVSSPSDSVSSVTFAKRGTTVWSFRSAASGQAFDPRLLEDTEGEMSVEVEVQDVETDPEQGAFLDLLFASGKYRYVSPVGPPPSRARPCLVPGDSGRPVTHQPCAATDGDFSSRLEHNPPPCPSGQTCPPPTGDITVDLGAEQPVGLVVVRGCPGACTIQTSSDGTAWREVGVVQPPGTGAQHADAFLHPASPATGRFVRITSARAFDELREVTVWGPSAPAKAEPSGPSLLRRPSLPSNEAGRRWLWAAAAALALAAVVAATFWRAKTKRVSPLP